MGTQSQDPGLDAALAQLAERLGIDRQYTSAWGDLRSVPAKSLAELLRAQGTDASTAEAARAALETLERAGRERTLPPVKVVEQGEPLVLELRLPAAKENRIDWQLILEGEDPKRGSILPAQLEPRGQGETDCRLRWRAPLSGLPLGYHSLQLFERGVARPLAQCALIVVPARAHLPQAWSKGPRPWAVTAQLYSLRSERNWGIGDFTDLTVLVKEAAAAGASAVGLNPLHALFPGDQGAISPYSPSSRCFLNPIYLDVEVVPELAHCSEAKAQLASPELKARLAAARAFPQVDYALVWECKDRVLRLLFDSFRRKHLGPSARASARAADFRRFQQTGGPTLRKFAVFEALQDHFRVKSGARGVEDWPQAFRDPDSAEVKRLAEELQAEVERIEFLQWEADRQLGEAASVARAAGMSMGLYRDVAVGVSPLGAEAWGSASMLVKDASIGAPPDVFNPRGQSWGLTPLSPRGLAEHAYAPFIEALRANMRHAGAVRLDHVIGLQRLWWIPRGMGPAEGAYVRYPLADLLGIVALESVRHRCVVVGEDLGTLPAGFRKELERRGILSYRLVMFEREDEGNGAFVPPERYPALAVAAISTHDLATLRGFWTGRDLEVRRQLALFPSPQSEQEASKFREETRAKLSSALEQAGLLKEGGGFENVARAYHAFLARTRAALVLVQVEDLLGQQEQMNLPGTVDQHPNWRRKLSHHVGEVFKTELASKIVQAVRAER